MRIPSDYADGYEKARAVNPELAASYLEHLFIGDPAADAVIEDLAPLGREKSARFIEAAMARDKKGLQDAPASLIALFEELETRPDWFDPAATLPGSRLFYRYPYVFTAALAGAGLVEGFTSGIAKTFMYTGRLLTGDQGKRRLKQNNRHQMEIFLPHGLEPYNEGWKLSIRIRLVHAQIRRLVSAQTDWETDAWGIPASAAHMALANTVFSARVLKHIQRLLYLRPTAEERQSFMLIWRYVGYLMGVPEALLTDDEERAKTLFDLALLCEPPPSLESVVMANTLINSVPELVGVDGRVAQRLVRRVFRLSRALIGDELADALQYPKLNTWGSLLFFALEQRATAFANRWISSRISHSFEMIAHISHYERHGISYVLPDAAAAERTRDW